MKVAIMQPYFFPYIGYYQLMHEVDTFVIFDDANFIKKGWVHRNQILMDGEPHPFILPIQKMSQNKLISEHERALIEETVFKQIKQLRHAYHNAPYFEEAMPVLESCLTYPETNVAAYLSHGLIEVVRYLGIDSTILRTSDLQPNRELKGQERIIDYCQQLDATHYINAINGMSLYDQKSFQRVGIELSFLQSELPAYKQGTDTFHPYLSIIDCMMNCSIDEIHHMLHAYDLVTNRQTT
ncbi:MAG: WbqC family protein [Exiguobacterium marinum]|uniref:WbqC family protein n=1 Tax=Exiguobacterium marinum TaxID=273528 RepID=UPI003C4FDCEB